MMTLISQELYKLFKRRKTLVVIIGFILLIVALTYGFKSMTYYMQRYEEVEYQIEDLEYHISYLEDEVDNIPEDIQGDDEAIERYQDRTKDEIAIAKAELEMLEMDASRDLTWEEALRENIKNKEEAIESNSSNLSPGALTEMKMELDELKYLEEHNIEPQVHEFNGFTHMNSLVDSLGEIFILIGIAVFAADMVSGEWTPPTMKLLLAQPVSRSKVLLAKFIATVIAAIVLILLIEILSFIVVGIFFEFGDMDYPMIINRAFEFDYSTFLEDGTHPLELVDGSWDIVPVWKYTLSLLGYQSLFILVITSFVFMISSLAKSSMISMGVSVVGLIAANIVFHLPVFDKVSPYVFTSYYSAGDIIGGYIQQYFGNPNLTGTSAIVVMVGWTVACYVVSHASFTKRDLLV